ncbi:MAG: M67 family metallopeptidase [Candidatus Omnitrophica bacterium]|nr:M67 family metallopeptidase [Candidatus Omnitrophota bacterium]
MKPALPETWIKSIYTQAEAEYPKECCGMILGPKGKSGISRLRPCKNRQDDYHARDPENFPRSARAAYFIDPRELLEIQKEIRKTSEEIRIIYHSHVDAGAHFSEEDRRIAISEGEPTYPGVDYLVVSVIKGKATEMNLFLWDREKRDYRESSSARERWRISRNESELQR